MSKGAGIKRRLQVLHHVSKSAVTPCDDVDAWEHAAMGGMGLHPGGGKLYPSAACCFTLGRGEASLARRDAVGPDGTGR